MRLHKGVWIKEVDCGKVTWKIRILLTKFVCIDFSWLLVSISSDKDAFLLGTGRAPFTWEIYVLL
jgi:hypothetical protein